MNCELWMMKQYESMWINYEKHDESWNQYIDKAPLWPGTPGFVGPAAVSPPSCWSLRGLATTPGDASRAASASAPGAELMVLGSAKGMGKGGSRDWRSYAHMDFSIETWEVTCTVFCGGLWRSLKAMGNICIFRRRSATMRSWRQWPKKGTDSTPCFQDIMHQSMAKDSKDLSICQSFMQFYWVTGFQKTILS